MRIIIAGVALVLLLVFLGFGFIINDDKEAVVNNQEIENNTYEQVKDKSELESDDNKGAESMSDNVADEKINISEETNVIIDNKTEVTPSPTPVVTTPPAVVPVPEPEPKVSSYTLSEVAKHDNASSCWTVVNGSVYDLTLFIKEHPGGSKEILEICGIDGTEKFSKQHGGDSGPKNTLENFYIGEQI